MLTKNTIKVSEAFAKDLVTANIKLDFLNATALQELCLSVQRYNGPISISSDEGVIDQIQTMSGGNYVIGANGEKSYAMSSHDAIMEDYTNKLSTLVTGHIKYAKTVVNVAVKELHESIISALDNYKEKQPEDFFNVHYYKLPSVFRSPLIDTELSQYKEITNNVKDVFNTNTLTEGFDVSTYLLTDNVDYDTYIKSWLDEIGPSVILNYIVNEQQEYAMDIPTLLNYNLANYLFYRNLSIRTDLNLNNTMLQLRVKAANNRNIHAANLYQTVEQYEKTIRNKQLLTTNSATNVSIIIGNTKNYDLYVYEESFNELAESGCGIEALFGFIAKTNNYDITTTKLIDGKDYYTNIWLNVRSAYAVTISNTKLITFKTIINNLFFSQLDAAGEEEKEVINSMSDYNTIVKGMYDAYIKTIDLDTADNIDELCLYLVANVRFYYSNAYYILSNMNKLLKINDKMTPEEAGLYSIIEYLVDFFIKQINIVKE